MNYFTHDELRCKCGCDELIIDEFFIHKIEKLREFLNFPFIVNSFFRCIKHNEDIGGAKNSYHLRGQAMDIRAEGLEALEIIETARRFNIRGIIAYPKFIHLDNRREVFFKVNS